jgi:glycosyltransferase involved in cell wall biosynthesis
VETSGVGGTHPALVEAMAFGACVVAHDTPENLETLGGAGLAYNGKEGADSLRLVLARLLNEPELAQTYAARAKARAQSHYNWETVTDDYEVLFHQMRGQELPARLAQRAGTDHVSIR